MLSYLYRLVFHPSNLLFKLLLLLSIIMVIFMYLRMLQEKEIKKIEGFTQNESYVFKENDEKYDTFYSEYYEDVHNTKKHNNFEIMLMLNQTMPSKKYSTILDVGCGTGCLVDQLTTMGFHAFGVDKSKAMIETAEKNIRITSFNATQ